MLNSGQRRPTFFKFKIYTQYGTGSICFSLQVEQPHDVEKD